METLSLKVDKTFLHDMEAVMKRNRYATKTEFMREAIRFRVRDLEKEEALRRVQQLYGASKRKTTDAELHAARERAFAELEQELK